MDNTFLKWAGGKNWFVRYHSDLFPKEYKRYIEPFLGGGSVYFYLEPQKAILSDRNNELITTYQAVRDCPKEVMAKLKQHAKEHSDEYYYKVRKQHPKEPYSIAARMVYLNRSCFNGIYRVNKKGEFNTPRGSKNNILLGTELFEERSQLLHAADISCCDFEETINKSKCGDFLFCDPPYAIKNERSFVEYTKDIFNWNDQIRLCEALKRAKDRGVKILMTNVNHPSIRSLYEGQEGFTLCSVSRKSPICAKKEHCQEYSELIVSANMTL